MAAANAYDPIHLDELQARILDLRVLALTVRGKRVVLVVGLTGSGKSTVINYLQGRKMKEVFDESSDDYHIDVADDDPVGGALESPKIGHSSVSETKVPGMYECGEDFVLIDTAGFLDSHGVEANLANHIALSFIVKEAASIAGIITVTDLRSIKAARGGAFKLLVAFLDTFLADPSARVCHVFTRVKSHVKAGEYVTWEVVRTTLRGLVGPLPGDVPVAESKELTRGIQRIADSAHVWAVSCLDPLPRKDILQAFRGAAHDVAKGLFRVSLPATEKALLVAAISKPATEFSATWSSLKQKREESARAAQGITNNDAETGAVQARLAHLVSLHTMQVELKALPAKVTKVGTRRKWDGDLGRMFGKKKTVSFTYEEDNPAVAVKQASISSFVALHPELKPYNDPAATATAIETERSRVAALAVSNATHRDTISKARAAIDSSQRRLEGDRDKYHGLAALASSFALASESPELREFLSAYAAFTPR